jgi:hypothetical protein
MIAEHRTQMLPQHNLAGEENLAMVADGCTASSLMLAMKVHANHRQRGSLMLRNTDSA